MQQKPLKFNYNSIEEMQLAAKEILPEIVIEYLNAGAGQGISAERNLSSFNNWAFMPKRLKGILNPDVSIDVFGYKYSVPFGAAPVGIQGLFHKDAEIATAKACMNHNAPCILSTVSNLSYAEASKTCKIKPWFQLYPTDNFKVTKHLLSESEKAGAEVIVLTVDVPVLGKRKHHARALLDRSDFNHLSFGNLNGVLNPEDNIHNEGLNWDLFSLIKETTNCKIVVKGIIHPEDAKLCFENGANGIIVSNHGGRQLDSGLSTLDALTNIISKVPFDYPVFIDGGFRSAEDVLKALILGAKMVFLGRPICYGLAVGGQTGVDHLWKILRKDLERTMKLMGIANLQAIDRSQLVKL